jgi:hypothetical protein
MVILYIYSTCWRMKLMFYECQHIPKLKLLLILAKPNLKQCKKFETTQNVDPSSNLPNESMWSYLVVPTYLMELLWNFFTLS